MTDIQKKIRQLKNEDRDHPSLWSFFIVEGFKWLPFLVLIIILFWFTFSALEWVWNLVKVWWETL